MYKVLIVDDDRVICRCLQNEIDWKSIDCEQPLLAYNGVEALNAIEQYNPQVVISDVRMPVMGGIDLCEQIWKKYPDINVMILSAFEDFKVAQIALHYNVREYILKPINRESLLAIQNFVWECTKNNKARNLCEKIIKGEYEDYLKVAIGERDEEAIDEFFVVLAVHERDAFGRTDELWDALLYPLFTFERNKEEGSNFNLDEIRQRLSDNALNNTYRKKVNFIRELYRSASLGYERRQEGIIITEIRKIVKKNYRSPDFCVAMIGSMLHKSSAYLGGLFSERTGTKLIDYITDMRIEYACKKLENTSEPIKEIAKDSGYVDANYFTRAFKKKMGMSPNDYRGATHIGK